MRRNGFCVLAAMDCSAHWATSRTTTKTFPSRVDGVLECNSIRLRVGAEMTEKVNPFDNTSYSDLRDKFNEFMDETCTEEPGSREPDPEAANSNGNARPREFET